MREHPIPQDLTGYRFHIVGNMTLKQFVEVASGVVISVILYKTNLIPIVKWPLIFLSFGIGAAIAWVPFEERPLDHWVTTFFSILYKPTKFFWRKQPKILEPFLFKPRPDQVNLPDEVDLTPARQARIREYITSVNEVTDKDPWETEQAQQISQMLSVFDEVEVSNVNITKRIEKPNLEIRVRDLHDYGHSNQNSAKALSTEIGTKTEPSATLIHSSESIVDSPMSVTKVEPIVEPPQSEVIEAALPPIETSVIAEVSPVEVVAAANPKSYESNDPNNLAEQLDISAQASAANFMTTQNQTNLIAPAESVTINSGLPFPSTPTQPNKLVGMVLDPDQKLVANAIVEIKNLQGQVARAVKTNALGQFFIATPLENGVYVVSADKFGLNFSQQQLVLDSQIVPPIQITALT